MEKPLILRFPESMLKEHPVARRGRGWAVCLLNVY